MQIRIYYNNILGKYFLNRFYFFHYDFGYKNSFLFSIKVKPINFKCLPIKI